MDLIGEANELLAVGRAHDAAALLREAIASGRAGPLARLAYGRALLAAGLNEQALIELRELRHLLPSSAEAATALGDALLAQEALPVAIAEYQRALRLDSSCQAAELGIARAWLAAGEWEKAQPHLAALDRSPAVSELETQIAEMRALPRSPEDYVRHLFDDFAHQYDARMNGPLQYRAPANLLEMHKLVGAPAPTDILDLGCGTGLAGLAFKPLARSLTGVDLSPRMIELARARAVYDALHVADIEDFLARDKASYGLILAADVLVYLGDLGPIMCGVCERLRPGGFFIFTTERSPEKDFELGEKRRWRHSEAYLKRIAAAHGLELAGLIACSPRLEAGAPVEGFCVSLVKK